MIGGIGHWELLIIGLVILLLFGHRFPSVMGSVGEGIRMFHPRSVGSRGQPEASDSSIHN